MHVMKHHSKYTVIEFSYRYSISQNDRLKQTQSTVVFSFKCDRAFWCKCCLSGLQLGLGGFYERYVLVQLQIDPLLGLVG